jgi:hypothetical protein
LAAGPPRLQQVGGAGAFSAALTDKTAANRVVYPIGTTQSTNIVSNKAFLRIFEMGSRRSVVRGIIGPAVITTDLLDSVSTLVDSAIKHLISPGVRVWVDASISFIEQSTTEPDHIRVGLNVIVGYNLNGIDIEITV